LSRKNEHAEWVLGVRKCIIFGTGLGRAAACRLRGQFSKVNHHGMMPIFWSISRIAKMEHFLDPNHHALLRSRVVKNEGATDGQTDGHEYVGGLRCCCCRRRASRVTVFLATVFLPTRNGLSW